MGIMKGRREVLFMGDGAKVLEIQIKQILKEKIRYGKQIEEKGNAGY
jgi:TPP-dependent 2-oxoacid decarboxylase